MAGRFNVLVGAVLGAGLTAAAFLLAGDPATEAPEPSDERSALPPAEGGEAAPLLKVAEAPAMRSLAPSDAELRWLRGALERERVRRVKARVLPQDSGLEVLRRVLDHQADITPLMREFETFSSHVMVGQGGTHRVQLDGGDDPTKVELSEMAAGTEVIEFGPGTFRVRWRRNWKDPIQRLLIRGAGMEQTTLILAGDLITMGGELTHFRMQDVAVQGQVLDIRGTVAAIFDRVRFELPEKGSSAWLYAEGPSFIGYRECEFLGDGNQRALRLRAEGVVLFDHCVFYRLSRCIPSPEAFATKASRMEFRDCRFEHSRLSWDNVAYPVRVVGGRVQFGRPDLDEEKRRKQWGAQFAAEVRGTTFEPEPPLSTLAGLVRILDEIDVDARKPLVGIILKRAERSGRREFLVGGLDRERGRRRFWSVVEIQGERTVLPSKQTFQVLDGKSVENVLSLPDLVRRSGIDMRRGLTKLRYSLLYWDPPARTAVKLDGDESWPGTWVDARTGEQLKPPGR